MNPFQWLTIPVLLLLAARELVQSVRGARGAGWPLLRMAVWTSAAAAIAAPNAITRLAAVVGIQRGTDLVLYGLVFAFLGSTFLSYSRYARLRRQIIELVRHQAIREARLGPVPAVRHQLRKAA